MLANSLKASNGKLDPKAYKDCAKVRERPAIFPKYKTWRALQDQTSPESSAPSWDIGAGRPPAHQMSGHRGHSGMALSPKGQAARGTDSLDRSSGQQGGIELKQAAANPLLGQFHLQDGGRFVKAKLLPVTPVLQSSRAESSNSGVGSAHSAGVTHAEGDVSGLEDFVANGNAAEETGNRGGFTHRHGDRERWQEEGEDLGGPPAA
ncbi:hypothetical protein WJX75_004506 [Coccomyxa subellipsoidea]|uniref:Uncharacterized protein n=1 Tax=Coccomyxa subellipsoidea TaxID=248742 RepID=A0ABR2YAZ0_9CHLO